jgi:membrane protein DedA with SNARE-associated domain
MEDLHLARAWVAAMFQNPSFSIQHLAKKTCAYWGRVAFGKLYGTLLGEALRSRGEVQEEEVRILIVIVLIIVLIVVAYLFLSRRRR